MQPKVSLVITIIDFLLWGINNKSYQNLISKFLALTILFVAMLVFGRYISWSHIESKVNIKKLEDEKLRVKIDFCYFCGNELNEDKKVCPNCKRKIEQ